MELELRSVEHQGAHEDMASWIMVVSKKAMKQYL